MYKSIKASHWSSCPLLGHQKQDSSKEVRIRSKTPFKKSNWCFEA